MPASARPIADEHGRTSTLHYSPAHLRKIYDMKQAGRRVKLPVGVTMDDLEARFGTPQGSTDSADAGNLPSGSATPPARPADVGTVE